MNTREILTRLVRRFGLLFLLTLIGVLAGAGYAAVKTPMYRAQAYVVVTAEAGEEARTPVNFAQAYGRLATKGAVLDRAATTLGSRNGLADVVAATSPDAPVIEITATAPDAKRAAAIANAVAQGLVDFGGTRKDQTKVTLTVLATATVPASPSSPNPPLELAVGGAAGLLVGGLAVLAGVGRRAAADRREEPTPLDAPAATTRYEVSALVQDAQPMPAIGTASATVPAEISTVDGSTVDDKIVGRAVVIYRDPR